MAHSSNYVRIAPERSRSWDDPMWQSRHPQHRNQHRDSWHEPTKSMMTSWTPRHAMCCPPLAEMKNLLCSPTISCLTSINLTHSRCTTCYTTSANTSGTRGIATFLRPQWTSGGKMRLETLSLSTMRTALSNSFMNIVLIGLKVKNLAFYSLAIFDISRLTISRASCV